LIEFAEGVVKRMPFEPAVSPSSVAGEAPVIIVLVPPVAVDSGDFSVCGGDMNGPASDSSSKTGTTDAALPLFDKERLHFWCDGRGDCFGRSLK
jgi:hypothetical protein